MSYRRFLDPAALSRLSGLDIIARLVVEGFIAGLHRSPYHGFSVEFAEHRQYMPGDPVKDVDWRVYAKSGRLYIKEYEEETNLKCYILLDCSRSMAFSSGENISKLEYGCYLSAALAQLMLRQRDAVGLVTFDVGIRSFIPPKSVKSHLHLILRELDGLTPSGRTRTPQVLHELAERIKKRGLVIFISDLEPWDDPGSVITGLKHFRHRKHEVIVFHILDPREIDLSFGEASRFIDLESGEVVAAEPWHIAGDYRNLMSQLMEKYRRSCRESFIDYVTIPTSKPFDTALFEYLSKRKKLG